MELGAVEQRRLEAYTSRSARIGYNPAPMATDRRSPPASPPPPGRRRARRGLAGAFLLAALVWAWPAAAQAQDPSGGPPAAAAPADAAEPAPAEPLWVPREWAFSAGVFDLVESDRAEAGVEVRSASRPLRLFGRDWRLEPAFGAMVNEDAGYYGYLAFRLPIEIGERWRATPFVGAGLYSAGDGVDLGGALEFRSGLEISVRLGERTGLGLSYYHLSNASIYDLNPGSESLVLVLAVRTRGGGAGGETGAGR